MTSSSSPGPPDDPRHALRRRGFALVETNYAELRTQIVRWLGRAYREDDTRADQVVLVLLRRIAGGKGLAPRLGDLAPGDPAEKRLLFANAKFVTAEIIKEARKQRGNKQPPTPEPSSAPTPQPKPTAADPDDD